MSKPLVNKVAQKAIVTIDIANFIPKEVMEFDVKNFLFKDLLLKEKQFRKDLMEFDFTPFTNQHCYITCTSNAIVPTWAYMLVSAYLLEVTPNVVFANSKKNAVEKFIINAIEALDTKPYEDKRLVIKGCGETVVTPNVYITLMSKLQTTAKAINFGEACSMVPVFKKRN